MSTLPRRLLLLPLLLAAGASPVLAQPRRAAFQGEGMHLVLEALDDSLLRFELAPGPAPATPGPIATSIMVARRDWPGPSRWTASATGVETAALRVSVAAGTLCVAITDRARGHQLTTLCPGTAGRDSTTFTLARRDTRHVVGLGTQFGEPGVTHFDWMGRERVPGTTHGNRMVNYAGGQVGNVQVPVMYALGEGSRAYALFLDVPEALRWDFRADPWRVTALRTERVRGYVIAGGDLPALRRRYLDLTGRPPVPPRAAFGLWVSEYGFEHWHELEARLARVRRNGFPVDGFVLDLQWFGGIVTNDERTPMGSLSWDLKKFPDPRATIARLRDSSGVGIIPIEESYVGRALAEHDTLARRGFLVRQRAGGAPLFLDYNPWWGKGGMFDWTSDSAAAFIHDWRRQPMLVDAGVTGHWTDLGEPELFDSTAWYHGVTPGRHDHASVHNLYNFKWVEGIVDGYRRHRVARRPFVLSRSGTAGIQRLGAALWSGDIGANFPSLAAQYAVQGHMSMSGVDWYGSDIGGFHRGGIAGDSLRELYTQWFAAGALTELPVRVHTENLCNCKETAPDSVGHAPSNLAHLRLRYSLAPYWYSLAHAAWRHGDAVVAPLVLWHQDDSTARTIGDEKLVGRDLLVALVARAGARTRDVYLPRGTWFDWHGHERLSGGRWLRDVPLYADSLFRLPVYARAGAIVPRMHVDARTMNSAGRRTDGTRRDELVVRVYADDRPSEFTLYEDDGETVAYATGAVATTRLVQRRAGGRTTVTIGARQGTYAGAPASRPIVVELVLGRGVRSAGVRADGAALRRHASMAALEAAGSGWFSAGDGLVTARVAAKPVGRATTFVFDR